MIEKYLPTCFSSFSDNEIKELTNLPWKTGYISDLISEEFVFLVTQGTVQNNSKEFFSINDSLLGLKPFIKQKIYKYKGDKNHKILYLPTKDLASFFLENPSAMRTYLLSQKNMSNEIISRYDKFSRKYLVYAESSILETVHFALSLAIRSSEITEKKSIYLEFNTNGVSIFQLLNISASKSILQTEDNSQENFDLSQLIQKNKVSYIKDKKIRADVDILNIHYLSLYQANKKQWAALFLELEKNYENIIIHLSDKPNNQLFENVDVLFVIEQSSLPKFQGFHPDENNILWPLLKRIHVNLDDNSYPLKFDDNQNIEEIVPDKLNKNSNYWIWFNSRFEYLLHNKTITIIKESNLQYTKTLQLLNNSKKSSEDLLKKNHIIFEGSSLLAAAFYYYTKENQNNNESVFDISKYLEPIYPKSGFFSYKKLKSKLLKRIEDVSIENNNFSILTKNQNNNYYLSSSHSIIENIIQYSFLPYLLEEEKLNRKYFLSTAINTTYFFRIGYEKINLIFCDNKIKGKNLSMIKKITNLYFNNNTNISGSLIRKMNISEENHNFTIEGI